MSAQGSLDSEVLSALRRLIRATDLDAKQVARETGLTTSQLLVLQLLAERGALTIGAIAGEVGLAQGTVTTLVDRLEARGLVARQRSTPDRRQVQVQLAVAGRDLLTLAPMLLQTRFLQQFAALEAWEQHAILAALHRLADLMDARHVDAAPVLDVGRIDQAPRD